MSKKISLKKLVQIDKRSNSIDPMVRSTPVVKEIKIGEKCLRDEEHDTTPTQKGKSTTLVLFWGLEPPC